MSERGSARSNLLQLVLGLGVMSALLWWSFHDVSPAEVWHEASGLSLWWLLVYCILVAVFQELRVYAWGLILRAQTRISWGEVFAVGNFGQTMVYLLPIRLGEFVRPALIAADGKMAFGAVAATVALERIIDALVVSVVLVATVLLLPPEGVAPWFIRGTWLVAASFTGLSLAIGACVIWLDRVERVLRATVGRLVPRLLPPLLHQARAFATTMRGFVASPVALTYLAVVLGVWGLYGLKVYVLYLAFGLGDLPYASTYTVLGAVVVGQSVPGGPTAAGAFHYATRVSLEAFGVGAVQALSFATIMHLFQTIVLALCGLLGMWLGRIDLRDLLALRRQFGVSLTADHGQHQREPLSNSP